APDVGGGFGVKAILYPEDVALCLLAMRLGRAVKWVEQRREGLVAAAHARDHHYAVRAGFDRAGRLLAMDARIACNAGAYSVYPWTAGLEALMAGGLLAGPYKLEHYWCEVTAVATHTTPAGPYRGVARPATTFVMERVLDLGARALSLDPGEIRRAHPIGPAHPPVTSQGQGLETTMAQLAAGELGVPIESVRVVLGDTDATPFGLGAFASRQAVIGGGAAIRAAQAVRDKVLRIAAHVLEAAVEDME